MLTCTRKLTFDAGHRILNHEGKCSKPHGHTYTVYITAQAAKLDYLGRVVDFSVLKQVYGNWIESNWDHGFLIYESDTDLLRAMSQIIGCKIYAFPVNPTAENIAQFLLTRFEFVQALALYDVEVTEVAVWETPNCYAIAKRE